MTFEIINPESLGDPKGWNHGMLAPRDGRILFIAGQIGRDAHGQIVSGFVAQMSQALENVIQVVRQAGGQPEDVGQMTVYVSDLREYRANLKQLGEAWRRLLGRHYPAMALMEVSELVDEGALVEIEATAVI